MAQRGSVRGLLGAVFWCAAVGAAGSCHATAPAGGPSSGHGGAGGAAGSGGSGAGGSTFIDDAGPDGPPDPDAGGFCGNQIHQVLTHAPNLYFVFDVSGSMASPGGGGYTRYQLVQHA